MAKQKPGIYVPLSAYYFDDVAIMEAGEDAELLYVRMLAYAARQIEREGFIPEQVVLSRLGILPVVGTGGGNEGGNGGGSDAGTRAGKLVESGLLEKVDGGYRIRAWLKWNRSAEEVESTRQKDRDRKSADSSGSTKPGTGNGGGNGGGNEDGKLPGSGDQIQKQNQKQNQKHSPGSPTPIPDDWQPTPEHEAKARELNVDLLREAESFKAHAEANDRRAVRWNAAFTQWLLKARPMPRGITPMPAPGTRPLEEWELRG